MTSELKTHFKDFSPTKVAIRYDTNSRNSGIADVEVPDDAMGKRAIEQLNGSQLGEYTIVVMSADDFAKGMDSVTSQDPLPETQKRFPYAFVKRPKPIKKSPDALHDALQKDRFDIAFDITWTTLTATALNPCVEEGEPESCPPDSTPGEYAGYNKRWLMTEDGRLTISPFTVKSAIANGFANLLGGCYRVISKVEGHPDPSKIKEGNYYYTGKYKRYRVARDKSKPAIVKSIEDDVIEKNGKQKKIKKVVLKPVKEYLFKKDPPSGVTLKKGTSYYGRLDAGNRNRNINVLYTVREAKGKQNNGEIKIIYHGPYRFGMNLELESGHLNKQYKHRFYEDESATSQSSNSPLAAQLSKSSSISSNDITAEIDALNFKNSSDLKEKVYMGYFKHSQFGYDPRPKSDEGRIWYEELSSLETNEDAWVYYQPFTRNGNTVVESIGMNFQFKALFCHEDAVPEGYEACHELGHLCPRCRLFGMTGETELKSPEPSVKSLKGRFKSAALVSDIQLKKESDHMTIPFQLGNTEKNEKVKIAILKGQKAPDSPVKPIAKQLLLPLLAAPKPNKRDVPGYFNKKSGEIKGAKTTLHANSSCTPLKIDTNQNNGTIVAQERYNSLENAQKYINDQIDSLNNQRNDIEKGYAHRLRNYAHVCDSGISFQGVVGVDNADRDEIAALTLLLDTSLGDHAYKVGLNKAMGMGAVSSAINAIWIRKPETYQWERHALRSAKTDEKDDKTIHEKIKKLLKDEMGVGRELDIVTDVSRMIQKQSQLKDNEVPEYPLPGLGHWKGDPAKVIDADSFRKTAEKKH